MRKWRHGKKSIFVRWFVSYIILLLVIVAVSGGVYLYSYHTIKEQSVQMNQALLEKMQEEIDRRFSETRNLINSLLLDTDIQKTVKINGSFQISDREVLYRIYNNLMAKCASYESVSSLMVYFAQEDTIVSEQGHMSRELFYDLYYNQEWEDADAMKEFLAGQWNGQIQNVCNGKGEMELWFLQNSLPRGSQSPRATFVAAVADSQLRRWMEDIRWEEEIELFLTTDEEILSASSEFLDRLHQNELLDAKTLRQAETITLDGDRYLLAWQPSETTHLYYGMLLPINYAQTSARSIQLFMVAGTVLCLSLGLGISYALSGIHYSPLKNLLDTFGDYERRKNEDYEKNEFQWLTDKVNQMLSEQKEIKGQYRAKERSLRQQYLYRLLTYLYDDRAAWVQDLKREDIFCHPCNLVALLFQIHSDTFDSSLLHFVISNVLQELLEGDSRVEVAETGDSYAVIFNVTEPELALREQLEGVLDQLKCFLKEYAGVNILIACGDFEEGMDGIHLSYQKAREAGEFIGKSGEEQIIWYEDIRNRYTLFDYSIESEQRIINAIRVGEAEQACQWMKEIIEENFCRRELIPNMKICLFYELYGTVTKGAEEGGCGEYIEQLETGLIEVNRLSPEEISGYLESLIQGICQHIHQKEERSDRRLGDLVMKYVRENYQNPDLNISITALRFNLTPSYLSALFREQTGISLLEFINRTRVEKARELLAEGYTVTEVCTRTGFGSSGAFIRVFKRITGITPGQMKKCDMDAKY